jgi:SAM-dependent methyltransferase
MDLEGFDQFEAMIRSAFLNIEHPIEDMVGEGDEVAVRLWMEGTHTGDFMGVPASGKRFSVEGTAFQRIAGGKVALFWGFLDQLGLMQQIGGLPAPAGPGESRCPLRPQQVRGVTEAHRILSGPRRGFRMDRSNPQGTFAMTGLADAAADGAISVDALQYAPDKRAGLKEAARILRPGGRLVFTAFEVEPQRGVHLPPSRRPRRLVVPGLPLAPAMGRACHGDLSCWPAASRAGERSGRIGVGTVGWSRGKEG